MLRVSRLCTDLSGRLYQLPTLLLPKTGIVSSFGQLDFKYGASAFGAHPSFVFVRSDAHTSQACSNGDFPEFFPGPPPPFKDAICRSAEKGYKSAHLAGSGPCDVAERRGLAPDSFPRRGLELSGAALYNLPKLLADRFPPIFSWPSINYALIHQPTCHFEESRRLDAADTVPYKPSSPPAVSARAPPTTASPRDNPNGSVDGPPPQEIAYDTASMDDPMGAGSQRSEIYSRVKTIRELIEEMDKLMPNGPMHLSFCMLKLTIA